MIPVPSEAGFEHSPAPKMPVTSNGIVPLTIGTETRPASRARCPLRIASGTSFAFPAETKTMPVSVADDHQGAEAEAPAALDHLGHAIDRDDLLLEFEAAGIDSFDGRQRQTRSVRA
jgi:hypothetical protein